MVTASDLAATLRSQMDELAALVEPLSDEQASARHMGAWCVKETLSHLQGAEGETVLDGILRVIREDEAALDTQPGITNYNADRRDAPVGQLLAAVLVQYREIADVLAAAGVETLGRHAQIDLLAASAFGERTTLAQWAEAIVTMHVAGHIDDLRTHLSRTPAK